MSRVTECGARRLLHGLVKQMQFRVSIIALWSRNGSFQMPQSCQFLNRSVFRSLPGHESWLMTDRILSQVQAAKWDFCEECK